MGTKGKHDKIVEDIQSLNHNFNILRGTVEHLINTVKEITVVLNRHEKELIKPKSEIITKHGRH